MSYRVLLSQRARQDLLETYRYIAQQLQSVQNADGQLSRPEKAILSLNEMPRRFRLWDNEKWQQRALRVMPVDHYLVFYTVSKEEQTVSVVRILYGGRDIHRQLNTLIPEDESRWAEPH